MGVVAEHLGVDGLHVGLCIDENLHVYEIQKPALNVGTIIIERVYDGGGMIPWSEIFCCGEVSNVFHWEPSLHEMGYYILDRKSLMIRLSATPAGPIFIKHHFIPWQGD